MSQNTLNKLWCVENVDTNIQRKFYLSIVISIIVPEKTKIDFIEN